MGQAEREIVLDTETTGLKPGEHRIIEVCAIVIEGTRETGEVYHQMFNPERDVDPEAEKVHGWNWEKLKQFPVFRREARRFAAFLGDAPIIAHNGRFDMGFLEAEFAACNMPVRLGPLRDTMQIARRAYPGQKVDLDTLCKRLGVDNSEREKHGAFIDVRLLIQVYIKLLGRDQLIPIAGEAGGAAAAELAAAAIAAASAGHGLFAGRAPRPPIQPTPDEIARHEAFVATLGNAAAGLVPIWLRGLAQDA